MRYLRVARSCLAVAAVFLAVIHFAYATLQPGAQADFTRRAASDFPDLFEASVVELQAGLEAGNFTSVDLIKVCSCFSLGDLGTMNNPSYQAYFARIDEVNLQRASLRAVIETNPSALLEAQILDEERAFFGPRGPLHGIPVLLKDNIGTIAPEGMYQAPFSSRSPLD
jgi:amidase